MINRFIEVVSSKRSLGATDREKIMAIHANAGGNFVHALLKSKIMTEQEIIRAMAELYAMPLVKHPVPDLIPREFISRVPIQFLKAHCMVPVAGEKSGVHIVMNDPVHLPVADDLAGILGHGAYRAGLSRRNEILSAINTLYDQDTDSASQLVEDMAGNGSSILQEIEETTDLLDDTSDAPVIKLVNHMISQSVKARASDIHIEPFKDSIKVRYRIDGILYDMLSPPRWIQSALVSRIKVMADMNIAEKRIPQDGRLDVRIGDQEIDIRVSTVPTAFGERLVLRLLNKSRALLELSQFGISPENYAILNKLIRLNNGIVLVTGPTGSGKTTTLYAALSAINSPDKNIITIEDPVEYKLKGIGQIQVNRKIGVTFAKGLRSIVRQDPDVILVGEIRDLETSQVAIQSALTGHLVFSTLHTNDAPSAVTRLVDLGVEPYLITSSVKAVIAQRLVRTLCPGCREAYTLKEGDIKGFRIDQADLVGKTVYRAVGCPACFNTGYSGRQAIFEIMAVNEALKLVILATSDANAIKAEALEQGMTTLRHSGIEKLLGGITTVEEVMRVTQD
ncbi:type II secretion system protein E (GspE) [Desulfocicer vacuolatum DSM 3385]|uniref:protein-secreting ATPase n=1 Tax=Desulfocicer vacuolatum DSM 3385 TaxID=1121400 RepID=A0A1W1ZF79_9BACT|nr:type II secretion system ATPase GspE [Desulfocicer vacuolatum]SMC47054.1 type II secretion system protein E (GspE) [Desulfocicer vacuolatum DSM 3385]